MLLTFLVVRHLLANPPLEILEHAVFSTLDVLAKEDGPKPAIRNMVDHLIVSELLAEPDHLIIKLVIILSSSKSFTCSSSLLHLFLLLSLKELLHALVLKINYIV